jgi:hypothetical protein
MSMITWNTNVNAPGCPGEILSEDGRSVLVQTDWDYPGVANTFGWSPKSVQKCPNCNHISAAVNGERYACTECDTTPRTTRTTTPASNTQCNTIVATMTAPMARLIAQDVVALPVPLSRVPGTG